MFSIVDIVAPASPVSASDLKKVLKFLKEMNLKPRLRGSLKISGDSLFAQSEKEAFKNFKQALEAGDSRLIWTLRGGYGSSRLLKYLDSLKKRSGKKQPGKKQPGKNSGKKIFIGHSDATVLHDFVHKNCGWPSLHFPVLSEMPGLALSSRNKFKKLISGKGSIAFSHLKILNRQKFKNKIVSQVSGGNMTLIQSLLGTPWSFSRKGILFLEDVNEKPYRIHRALWQIKHSGVLKNICAVIFGKWREDNSKIMKQALRPFAKSVHFPVFAGLSCGHTRVSDPLPFGTKAELSLKNGRGLLELQSPFLEES